jgi:5-methylcytosine-specific restriction protein A
LLGVKRSKIIATKFNKIMNTFLLTWNPSNWPWETLEKDIKQLEKHGVFRDSWSCGNKKHTIKLGDRVFLMRLGSEPKGIVASGYTTSDIYQDEHWDKSKQAGMLTSYVKIDFDVILNPEIHDIVSADYLTTTYPFKNYSDWFPRSSGNRIDDLIASELENTWFNHLNEKSLFLDYFIGESETYQLLEGNKVESITSRYERNPYARQKCLQKHGYNCSICGFNFEQHYGTIGKDYIHVHHINPLNEVQKAHLLNPETDLIPVCPNCHSMLHRVRPALTIDEIKNAYKKD